MGGTVRAGVDVRTPGDFTLARDVNMLDSLHWGNQATNLTIRAGGNVNLNGSLSDGFASATRANADATAPVAWWLALRHRSDWWRAQTSTQPMPWQPMPLLTRGP